MVVSSVTKRLKSSFPFGTFIVNILGSFLLGHLLASGMPDEKIALLGTGFLGAFTTFSTFNFELIQLLDEKKIWTFWSYIGFTYCVGILSAYLGYIIK